MVGFSDLAFAFAVAFAVAGAFTVVRGIRAYRRLRRRVLALGDAGCWTNQRDRRRLWRAVVGAERAVSAAGAAGVSTGDLSSVARRLHLAATTLDAGLVSSRRSSSVLVQVAAIIDAADEVTRAANDAVAADVADQTRHVLDAARLEIAAIRGRGC